jgi:hypothetical protein
MGLSDDQAREIKDEISQLASMIERRRRASDDFDDRLRKVEEMIHRNLRLAVMCSMGLGSLVSALVTLLLNLAFGR